MPRGANLECRLGQCVCPTGLSQCVPGVGPACCNDQVPIGPGYTECCDNACCHFPNQCVAEELCCPRLPDIGCVDAQGNCCTTVCKKPQVTPVLPHGGLLSRRLTSADLCCAGNTTCCDGGTNSNVCVDLSQPAQCCIDSRLRHPTVSVRLRARSGIVLRMCASTPIAMLPPRSAARTMRASTPAGSVTKCCLSNRTCADTCEACVNYVCVDDP